MRITAIRWAELVEAWGASGRTAASFAAEQGISETSLRWWKTEVSRRARKQSARRSPGPGRRTGSATPVASVALARVVREGETPPPPSAIVCTGGSIDVMLGHVRVVVGSGFNAQLLRDVVRALSERP